MHFTDEKSKKIHRGCLEAEGEKISVTLAGDVSCDVCVNFTHQGLAWGRVRRCFELVAHVNGVAVFGNGDGYYSPVKKQKGQPGTP